MKTKLISIMFRDLRLVMLSRGRMFVLALAIIMLTVCSPGNVARYGVVRDLFVFVVGATISTLIGLVYALSVIDERREGRLETLVSSTMLTLGKLLLLRMLESFIVSIFSTVFILAMLSLAYELDLMATMFVGLLATPLSMMIALIGFVIPREFVKVFPAIIAVALWIAMRSIYTGGFNVSKLCFISLSIAAVSFIIATLVLKSRKLYESIFV